MWEHIFNGKHSMGSGDKIVKLARQSGYKMFSHNGKIYRVPDSPQSAWDAEPLGITVENIK